MFWNQRYARDGWAIESGQYQRSTRGRLPSWYVNQPPSARGDDLYLLAFSCLGTERSFPGNGIGPIPWGAAFDYAARSAGFDRRMCTYFATVILVLDGHYRDHLREEQKKESDREARRARRKAKAEGTGGKMSGLQRRRQARK